MQRLTPDQYPLISHVLRDEVEFPAIALTYQRREGEFWVDRLDAPRTVIGLCPKDSFAWGDLSQPGVGALLARGSGPIADTPGLEPILMQVWPSYQRNPFVEYRYVGTSFDQAPLPASGRQSPAGLNSHRPRRLPPGFRLVAVGPAHVDLLCAYRPRYRREGRIGDYRSFDDFLAHGFGYAVIDESAGRIASACMAHAVTRRVDHSLRTLAGYEGLGLGTAVTYATILEGARRGLEPIWWTEVDNHGSRAIAEKIGLKLVAEPIFYDRGESA